MADIRLEKLTKVYSDGTHAVSDLDLEIADGELIVFVGPSGCGKTTTLRMIAGLESITKGTVSIGGRAVNKVPPQDRDVAMVFQSYALYPHMSARENMAFGLRQRKVPKGERDQRIEAAARVLGLFDVLDKKPRALSGGQRQRVAMGRAIVREPQAFLMDEPLSNLDAKLRVEVRAEIARLQRELEVTTVYVTHDQSEAMTLGHRVAVMRDGVLQQIDTPQRLYEQPANIFVGQFIGSPGMNLVGADLVRDKGRLAAKFGDHTLLLPFDLLSTRPALTRFEGKRLILGIRPADLDDATLISNAPDDQRLSGVVDIREDVGSAVFLHFAANGDGTELVARVSRDTRAKEGDQVDLVADPRRLHFFDPDTGLPIDRAR